MPIIKLKKTWKIINSGTLRKTSYGEMQSLKIGNKSTNNQQIIAEAFISIVDNILNKSQVYTIDEDNSIYSDSSIHFLSQTLNTLYPHMKYRPTTIKEIDNIIKSLKAKDSYGYNEISTEVPKIGSSLLYALTKGIFPDRMKLSVKNLCMKRLIRLIVSNYRPISFLNPFSKNL